MIRADEAYPLPDLPLWTSLAIVATYAVCTLCAIAIALWRAFYSPKARGGGSRRWPLRGLLYGLLITSFVSRVAEFSLSQLLADAAVRTAVLILNALGAAFNWASFTLVVCFIEEVRRSAKFNLSQPVERALTVRGPYVGTNPVVQFYDKELSLLRFDDPAVVP